MCSGSHGFPGGPGAKGVMGRVGDTGATGATFLQVINRRVARQAGCPGAQPPPCNVRNYCPLLAVTMVKSIAQSECSDLFARR